MARCQTTSCARVNFLQRASMPPVSRALLAVRYLTILPLSRFSHAGLEALGRAAPWSPVVGAALGLVLAAVDALTVRVFPPLLAALLTVTVWKFLTGGLHLDGLADCLDGLAGRDPAERRAIMSDSRIGAFGAIGLIFFLMLESAAVSELPHAARWRALVAAPGIARATPALLGRLFRSARAGGQGALFSAGLGRADSPARRSPRSTRATSCAPGAAARSSARRTGWRPRSCPISARWRWAAGRG